MQERGFSFSGKKYSFRISAILADAPARSFLKGTKAFNSLSGCDRCNTVAESINHRTVYQNLTFEKRTDETFRQGIHSRHHKTATPLSELKLGLVTQIPLDYLHLVCLGVTRKLFRTWVKGKPPFKLQSRDILMIGERLENFAKCFPNAFQRRPRSIVHVDHFKGTEFRSLLLYTGVVALKGILDKDRYRNFLFLHTAMFILLSPRASQPEWNELARNLLLLFVKSCLELYGSEFMVYNVHSLLHLHDDALIYGSLDNISTFPYESFMQNIKSYIHSHNFELEQVAGSLKENC